MNTPTTIPATAATETGASFRDALYMDRDTGAGGMVADPYAQFLESKKVAVKPMGFDVDTAMLSARLFPIQRDIVRWALRRGRASLFEACGFGKTLQFLEIMRAICEKEGRPGLAFTPLAVAAQTVDEGRKFGIPVNLCRSMKDAGPGLNVTNYDMLQHFDPNEFCVGVVDEVSCIKAQNGAFYGEVKDWFSGIGYRYGASATPAPNDYMELGNQAEFLGIMTRAEMLAMFFTHDGGDTSKWRLKRHAEADFWKWVCSWAVMVQMPSDLGYSDEGYVLPPITYHQHVVESENDPSITGTLFEVEAQSLIERGRARKNSVADRVKQCADIVNASSEPWVVWCNLNEEGDMLERSIRGCVQVAGADSRDAKESKMTAFSRGEVRVMISKPSVAGYGMNWQHCANVAFVGLSDSWEQYYQAIRRCWRFGQTKPVHCHIITSSAEGAVVRNIERKESDAAIMASQMVKHMSDITSMEIRSAARETTEYRRGIARGSGWELHQGDCVEVFKEIPSDSVGYTIYSPPFESLYTYSNSDRDMGNCRDSAEFAEHFRFLIPEMLRVTMPGRLMSFHCMNLPVSKTRDGFIGVRDFRGELIRMFIDAGWIFHSEVCIWKDPVTAMQRTKAIGLLHKQLVKDSAMSRQGIPDYLVTMRKPGINPVPVSGKLRDFVGSDPYMLNTPKDDTRRSIEIWQRYASPVWMDINPSRTLQYMSGRDEKDERHICPLQLDVIERALQLWTMPGDLVATPFAGIGSELYCAVKMGRRAIGSELKPSYFATAVKNIRDAEQSAQTPSLFDADDVSVAIAIEAMAA
jgi:hypothetical protein